ncbi:hypothetical protein ACVWXM_007720 [Bradyrhizobium sp. GM7.3]
MASLFKPEVPQQDPAVRVQQEQEQQRAAAANTKATQTQLALETNIRNRRNGIRSLIGAFGSGSGSGGSLPIPTPGIKSSLLGSG